VPEPLRATCLPRVKVERQLSSLVAAPSSVLDGLEPAVNRRQRVPLYFQSDQWPATPIGVQTSRRLTARGYRNPLAGMLCGSAFARQVGGDRRGGGAVDGELEGSERRRCRTIATRWLTTASTAISRGGGRCVRLELGRGGCCRRRGAIDGADRVDQVDGAGAVARLDACRSGTLDRGPRTAPTRL
jgi:hypothetical protein